MRHDGQIQDGRTEVGTQFQSRAETLSGIARTIARQISQSQSVPRGGIVCAELERLLRLLDHLWQVVFVRAGIATPPLIL